MNKAVYQSTVFDYFHRLTNDKELLFWTLQLFGWGGLFIVSSLTLTLFYNNPEWPYIAHNLARSILGIIMTWPMRVIYTRVWSEPVFKRLRTVILTALVMSILWTLVIIQLFEIMTNEVINLYDYGGWLYSSIFIFMSWAATYHGVKYYLLLQEEHKTLLLTQAAQQRSLLKRYEAENHAKHAQLKFLSYQLNPHFLFNTLNSVYSMIETSNNEGAKKMISQLSQFLRSSLNQQQDDILVPMERELDILKKYLEIEQTRFGDRLRVEFDCQPNSMSLKVPVFLLQPLVENSIKHAISKSVKGGTIRVSSLIDGEQLVVTVEDSGDSSDTTVVSSEGTGIGLRNTQERLAVLYQQAFSFEQSFSELGGSKIIIRLPINTGDS